MTDPVLVFSEVVSQRAALMAAVQDFSVTLRREIVNATTMEEVAEIGKRVEQLYPLLTPRYPPGTPGS